LGLRLRDEGKKREEVTRKVVFLSERQFQRFQDLTKTNDGRDVEKVKCSGRLRNLVKNEKNRFRGYLRVVDPTVYYFEEEERSIEKGLACVDLTFDELQEVVEIDVAEER